MKWNNLFSFVGTGVLAKLGIDSVRNHPYLSAAAAVTVSGAIAYKNSGKIAEIVRRGLGNSINWTIENYNKAIIGAVVVGGSALTLGAGPTAVAVGACVAGYFYGKSQTAQQPGRGARLVQRSNERPAVERLKAQLNASQAALEDQKKQTAQALVDGIRNQQSLLQELVQRGCCQINSETRQVGFPQSPHGGVGRPQQQYRQVQGRGGR